MNKQWLSSILLLAFSCSAAGPSTWEKLQNLRKKTQDKASHFLGDYGEGVTQIVSGVAILYSFWFIHARCFDKNKIKQEPLKSTFYLRFDKKGQVAVADLRSCRRVELDLNVFDGKIEEINPDGTIDRRQRSLSMAPYSKKEYCLGTVISSAAFANIYCGCRNLYNTWQKNHQRDPYVIYAEDAMKK